MSSLVAVPRNTSRFGLKQIVIAALLLILGAVSLFAIVRESRRAPEPTAAQLAGGAFTGNQDRPAVSAAQENYANALWPIHERVKASAVNMTYAGLSYKMRDLDAAGVKTKVAPLTKIFREARAEAARVSVPEPLKAQQDLYLRAIKGYEDASIEMSLVARDGKDQHLIDAQKLSYAASEDMLRVGDVLWPGEYKPN
jgi:hypothetical protein